MKRFGAIFRAVIAMLTAVCAASPAWAEWYEASSDHFVIYADDKQADIRRFAENLERYHSAMSMLTGRQLEKPSPSNRVTIFVVGGQRDIRRLAGSDSRSIAGFYIPRASGSFAFVQDIRNKDGYPDFSTVVLLHEYAHHFLMTSSRFAMPRWLNEGAAEFFAAATFNDDGSVQIGRAAQHRGAELAYADPVPVQELLDPALYEKQKGRRYDAFYGKSWLTYHYLTFRKERTGQLGEYQRHMMAGMDSLAAAQAAFGDLDVLERELKVYLRGKFMTFVIPSASLSTGTVAIRSLAPGEAEMMSVRMRSQRGVNDEQAAELVVEAREIAGRFPDDAGVYAALAETEFDAGNDDAAIAAANRAIALDPKRINAYVQKGYALFRQARDAEDKKRAYHAAMEPFEALNGIENDHPLPLIYYYRSYVERGAEPPENARAALERASVLAPFDQSLQLNVALMLVKEGKHSIARDFLAPIAASPHGGGMAERAKKLSDLLASVADGTSFDLEGAIAAEEGSGDEAVGGREAGDTAGAS